MSSFLNFSWPAPRKMPRAVKNKAQRRPCILGASFWYKKKQYAQNKRADHQLNVSFLFQQWSDRTRRWIKVSNLALFQIYGHGCFCVRGATRPLVPPGRAVKKSASLATKTNRLGKFSTSYRSTKTNNQTCGTWAIWRETVGTFPTDLHFSNIHPRQSRHESIDKPRSRANGPCPGHGLRQLRNYVLEQKKTNSAASSFTFPAPSQSGRWKPFKRNLKVKIDY